MSVQTSLLGLLKQISPTIQITSSTEPPVGFDFHCPMMSLPLALGTTLETIPAEHQYLAADEQLKAAWSARLPPKTKPRIGVVWSGSRIHENDRNRSMRLETFLPVLSQDFDWICLQKEIGKKTQQEFAAMGASPFSTIWRFQRHRSIAGPDGPRYHNRYQCGSPCRCNGQTCLDIVALQSGLAMAVG